MEVNKLIPLYLKSYRLTSETPIKIRDISRKVRLDESNYSRFERGNYFSPTIFIDYMDYYQIYKIYDDFQVCLISKINDKIIYNDSIKEIIESSISNKTKIIIDDIYYLKTKPNAYFMDNVDRRSLFFPYELLHQYVLFIMHSHGKIISKDFEKLEKTLLSTIKLFDLNCQMLFKLARNYIYRTNSYYVKAEKTINDILKHNIDEKIKIICHYYLLIIYNTTNEHIKALEIKSKLEHSFEIYPCSIRQIQFLGAQSLLHFSLKDRSRAISILKKAIKLAENIDNRLYAILSYNLAYNSSLQKNYEEALKYYLISLAYSPDNTTCFGTAWCYFNLNDNENAIKYIEMAQQKDMLIYKDYSSLFCCWLNSMIKTPYYQKCERILLKIQRKYEQNMHPQSKEFLYERLLEYYKCKGNHELALEYSMKIIELYRNGL